MKNEISKYVGNRIRYFRKRLSLTQKELGERIGVKHNTISSFENGTNEPSQNVLFLLANELGVSINEFFPKTDQDDEIDTIAAHHDDEEWTEEELKTIEEFKKFVKSQRKKKG